MNHEVWRLAASGLLTTLVDAMIAVTDRDARSRLWDRGVFDAMVTKAAYDSLAYVPEQGSIAALRAEVKDPVYNPHAAPFIPMVEDAYSDGTTLSCTAPPEPYEVVVYVWDFTTFSYVGTLLEASAPGSGWYVLALRDRAGTLGLPSLFLEVL